MARAETYLENTRPQEFEENFSRWYPDGTIVVATPDDLPKETKAGFEARSRRFICPESYKRNDFYGYLRVQHRDGGVSWAGWRKPFIDAERSLFTMETDIYVHDTDVGGQSVGIGEIAYQVMTTIPFFKNKPFSIYSETETAFQRQGYALRRVVVMNALSRVMFGYPLYSSDLFLRHGENEERVQQKTWERLVCEGVARKYLEGKVERYVFDEQGKARPQLKELLERIKKRRTCVVTSN